MSMREKLGSTLSVTTSAIRHLGWWIDWHARARPSDGSRGLDDATT